MTTTTIRLLLDLGDVAGLAEAGDLCRQVDGVVAGPAVLADHGLRAVARRVVVSGCEPRQAPQFIDRDDVQWATGVAPEECARLRDRWPSLAWVPRADIERPVTRFDFHPGACHSGFKTYMPDLRTYRGFQLAGVQTPLREWLGRLAEFGFDRVWLHGLEAAARGRGFDLDLLAHARGHFPGRLWLSGGAGCAAHLRTLADEGGVEAAVADVHVARREGVDALREALRPRVAVRMAAGGRACAGRAGGGRNG